MGPPTDVELCHCDSTSFWRRLSVQKKNDEDSEQSDEHSRVDELLSVLLKQIFPFILNALPGFAVARCFNFSVSLFDVAQTVVWACSHFSCRIFFCALLCTRTLSNINFNFMSTEKRWNCDDNSFDTRVDKEEKSGSVSALILFHFRFTLGLPPAVVCVYACFFNVTELASYGRRLSLLLLAHRRRCCWESIEKERRIFSVYILFRSRRIVL